MKDIPKVCRLYWGGSGPLPHIMVFTILSFHKYNPDWEIIVYRTIQKNENLGQNRYVPIYDGKDYFHMIEELPYVKIKYIDVADYGINKDAHSILGSDIFRANVLYREGGVYSDFDVIWLRPMSEFENVSAFGAVNDFESTVSYYRWTEGHHSVSVIVAKAGSPFLLDLIEMQKGVKPPYGHLAFSTVLLNKRYPVLSDLTKRFPNVLAVRYNTFYPYGVHDLGNLYNKTDLSFIEDKGVMCIHWFNGSGLSVDYENSGFIKDCSMTAILKKEGYI